MVNLPKTPQVVKKEKNKAVFEIEALYPGFLLWREQLPPRLK